MLRNLEIKNAYNSDEDDLVNDFYNSVLSESILYRRATGYFTSGSLSIAAIGITSLIHNSGKIQAITGYQVNEEDYQAIVDGLSNDFFVEEFTKEIETSQGTDLDHLKLLSWMIATDRFEMKIAFRIGGIFHQKIGILTDSDGDSISFSGSQNESAGGWRNNSEEFKVFRSWIPEENNYFQGDIERFEKYWNGEIDTLRVLPLPEVIKEELLYIKPKDEELPDIIARVEGAYRKTKTASIPGREKLYKKPLRGYQKTAVQNWLKDKRGIFEMATGTGKTLTALGVVDELTMHGDPLVTIIAAPQKHLVKQWEDEIRKQLGEVKIITCNSDNSTWRKELNQSLFNYKHKIISRLIVLTTYSTMSSEDFIKIIKEKSSSQKNFLIIADEMHNSGALKSRIGLLEEYNYRLGLSATPRRYFDEEGSELLLHYFGETVFRYDLKKAIEDGHLTPYNYYPIIVNLSDEEYQEYIDLTRSIIRQSNASDETESRLLEILTMKRSLITKKAVNKISSFQELISKLNNLSTVYNLLVYCQDSEQLVKAQKILNTHRIINHKLTDKESTQDRNTILKGFANKEYQAIVAMNCLDEGIDVPSTESAIILASSGNPRQYIQRRGRVLRKSDGKEIAHIYDFIVLPPPIHLDQSLEKYDRMIIKKELVRVWEFLDGANNKLQIINSVSPLMLHYNAYIDIEVENEN